MESRYEDKFSPCPALFKTYASNCRYLTKEINYLEKYGKFMPRWAAEYNNSVKQIIAYVVVINEENDKIFVSQRISGEERLKGSYSFFGGHVNSCDVSLDNNIIIQCAIRELNEEIIYTEKDNRILFMGTVQDILSPTGEHVGFVFLKKVSSAKIAEKENLNGEWMSYSDMLNNYSKFESWAKYIIDFLHENRADKNSSKIVGVNTSLTPLDNSRKEEEDLD